MKFDYTARDTAIGMLIGCGLGTVFWTLVILLAWR